MAVDLDRAAVEMGLNDVRDWLVLAALDDGQQRTQLELSRIVCVDKTTLISVLDRLEQHELVVRTVDPDRSPGPDSADHTGRPAQATPSSPPPATPPRLARWTAWIPTQRALLLDLLGRIADRQNAAQAAV